MLWQDLGEKFLHRQNQLPNIGIDLTLYPFPNENHHLECQKSSRTSVEKETWEAEIGIEYELD